MTHKRHSLALPLSLLAGLQLVCSTVGAAPADSLSLAGSWRFELDRAKAGLQEKWFARTLPGKIHLPGSLPAQGIGDDITINTKWTGDIVDQSWFTAPEYAAYRQPGNIKVPFWLQPDKHYVGAAWYQRDVEIPSDWPGKRIVLKLERPHWETRVWIDDREIGSNNSLSTPHEYDLGMGLAPGKHQLTILVDNSLVVDVGVNSHSITDHTQGNWNGIVGEISMEATPPVWIEDVQVFSNIAKHTARVKVAIGQCAREPVTVNLVLSLLASLNRESAPPVVSQRRQLVVVPAGSLAEVEIQLGEASSLWDEFHPELQRLAVRVEQAAYSKAFDSRIVTFGLREISTQGTQFLLNGRKTFIRGTLECCIFPKTGHPPTDVDSWKRIIRIAKSYGLNLLRFHSWCPPEAAFVAADELGFYYQVEVASWANQSTTLGDGKPVDRWLYQEAERILKAYGNHPSFVLMPYGNEPGGKNAGAYLSKWVDHWKTADPRRLYTSGSGWPLLPENQFHVTPDPRIQHWGAGLKSRINGVPPETRTDYREFIRKQNVPVISHEIGEWCVYPNFEEIRKYTGYLKPKNFEIFRDSLAAHHMGDLAHKFLLASGKLQTLCYKEDIESALRTPGMGGFELLDLHDFPGQGTALVGVLDPFWDEKGYVMAAEYSRFCNYTVPLARLSKRVFTTAETVEAELEVAHFGPTPMEKALVTWRLVNDGGKLVASGKLPSCDIPVDNGITLGSISIGLKDVAAPARYKLVVTTQDSSRPTRLRSAPYQSGVKFENDWDLWVYPAKVDAQPPADVLIAGELDSAALAALEAGGKVLLTGPPARVRGDTRGEVALGFSSIFWNTAWTHRQAPHTLGILCEPRHPALVEFPTDYHSNWQWWYLISRAGAMILDDLPKELRPTVQVIDDWVTNRKLGLVFEAKVGAGKLLVCSVDLTGDLNQNPVARQFRHSLFDYMGSKKFRPGVTLTAAQVRSVFTESR